MLRDADACEHAHAIQWISSRIRNTVELILQIKIFQAPSSIILRSGLHPKYENGLKWKKSVSKTHSSRTKRIGDGYVEIFLSVSSQSGLDNFGNH